MPSPDALMKATVSRLTARLGHGLAEAAAEVAVLAQDAPERIRREWHLFQEEVQAEAERLERDSQGPEESVTPPPAESGNPQDQIDRLRAKVADLNTRMEGSL
jgi:ubiquinone biosynthesis protein UbiJ